MATVYQQKDYPKIPEITRIGVIGAGQMGGGIAQVCAVSGLDVRVVETDTNIDGQFDNYASCTVVALQARSSPTF